MTRKKTFTDRAIAFFAALIFSMTLLLVYPAGTFNILAVETNMDITVSNISITVNDKNLGDEPVANNAPIKFSFDWALHKNTEEELKNPITIQFDLDGISLGNFSGELNDKTGTYTIENGNTVLFYLNDDVLKKSDITGECFFDGNVTFGLDDINNNNQIDVIVKYESDPIFEQKTDIIPEGSITMQKAASGNVYTDGSNYYQDYTITINADGTSASILNQIIDTPNELGGNFDATKGITVTTLGTVTGISDTYNNFDDISNITMGIGSQIVISYRMVLNESVLSAGAGDIWRYGNNAKVLYNNGSEVSSSSQPVPVWSEVTKTGSQPDSDGYITWTVTIYHNGFTGDPVSDRQICSAIDDDLTGGTGEHNFELSKPTLNDIINSSNYGNEWEHKYTYTYRTKIKEENTTADRSYKNTLKVTLDGSEREIPATVTVAGTTPIEKRATAIAIDSNKKMGWEVTYTVPANTTTFKITDLPTATSGKSHALVSDSIAVTVNNVASSAFSVSGNDITFDPSILTEGSIIVITYQTLASGDFTTEGSFTNKVKAVYTQNDEIIEKESNEASYPWDVINAVEKSDVYSDYNGANKLAWQIKINLKEITDAGYTLTAGDIITLDDVMTCSDASAPMPAFTKIYYTEANNAELVDECFANLSINDAKNKFTFTITQNMIDKGLEWFTFRYRMDFDDINNIKNATYTNTVTANYTPYGGNAIPAGTSSKGAWIQPNKSLVIYKYLDTYNMKTGNVVPFKIEVNKSELDLSSENTVTLKDTLGEILYFIPSSLVVLDGRSQNTPLDKSLWSYTYDNRSRTLEITLPDSRYCIVTYSAEVDTNFKGANYVQVTLPNKAVLECKKTTYENSTDSWSTTLSKGNASLTYDSGSFIINKGDFENNNILLDGASFRLVPGYFDETGLFTPFTDKTAHPTVTEEIITSQGKNKIEGLELENILYQMTEIAAPNGYKIDPSPRYIVIKNPGDENYTIPNNVHQYPIEYLLVGSSLNISNEKATVPEERFPVQFKKTESVNQEALEGATLSLYNADNVLIDTWTTTSAVYTVNNLLPGSYRLVETEAPTGYKVADPINFVISNIGTVSIGANEITDKTITMVDEPSTAVKFKVKFQKLIKDTTTPLSGATLQVKKKSGTVVAEWVTTNNAYELELEAGTYILSESNAPVGYATAADIEFVVSVDGTVKINSVAEDDKIIEMYDEIMLYSVKFRKTDSDDKNLAGAQLQLLDSDNKLVVQWDTTDMIKTVENIPAGTYTLRETSAPTGYVKAEDIIFTIAANGTVTRADKKNVTDNTIVMIDETETNAVTIKKVWNDAENQDGKRPEELKVKLSNGTEVILNEANKWTAKVDNLPKYDANGKEIKYTWTEGAMPDGYSLTDTSVSGTVTTLTNSYTPETTEATVNKIWNDAENQDGKRPEELKVTLSNGTEVTLNEANNWTATVENLPKYADGREIEYFWTEEELPEGYRLTKTEKNGTTTTLTNSYTPETTEATVKKIWNDAENQDGKRPTELKVKLSNGTEVTLNEANKWTATVSDLPKYKNGQEIKYTWTENAVPEGYELIDTQSQGTVTTIINKHAPELTSATIVKVWDDDSNRDGARPENITVTLSNGTIVVLSENNGWKTTVNNLPKYANGQLITYTWTEVVPEHYTITSNDTVDTTTTITNKHIPEFVSVTGTKKWDDNNNQQGKRPEKITVNLYGNNKYIDSTEVDAAANWKYSFNNLPKYKNGKEIVYTISEDTIYGYTPSYGNMYDIINTYTYPEIAVQVKKEWDDNNNYDGMRPDEITVNLFANDVATGKTATLNDANGWKYVFEKLPAKDANDQLINYTVTENAVEHYTTKAITGTADTGFVITNKYTPQKTSATVKKVWDDNNNQFNKRPENLDVILSNGERVTLNSGNNWTAQIDNLPMYADGKPVKYTWTEAAMPEGYELAKIEENGTVTTLTNKYVETVNATVKKIWNDDNNADGKRPASIVVKLSNGTAVTLSANNNWTVTVPDLPKYDASGAEIRYTWSEPSMPEGYRLTSTVVNGTVTTLTNTYTKQADSNNPLQPTPPNVPNTPDVPNVPNVPVRPINPFFPIRPDEDEPEEDVSSESGITDEADTIGNVDTTSYPYLAILLAITAGGIMIARRRQKK